jgi:hypothetical protein
MMKGGSGMTNVSRERKTDLISGWGANGEEDQRWKIKKPQSLACTLLSQFQREDFVNLPPCVPDIPA